MPAQGQWVACYVSHSHANGMKTERELDKYLGCFDRTPAMQGGSLRNSAGDDFEWMQDMDRWKIRVWLVNAAERSEAEALKKTRRLRVFDI